MSDFHSRHLYALILALSFATFHSCAQELSAPYPAIVMHDDIRHQWGAHTFCYITEGETGLFSSAVLHDFSDYSTVAVVSQYPKPDSSLPPAVRTIDFGPSVTRADPPHIIRTPDGYLHIFAPFYDGFSGAYPSNGHIRYYRSESPEDIRTLVDRSNLMPASPTFHLRTSFGIGQDGDSIAWVVLSENNGGYQYDTPLLYRGHRSGLDFVFSAPIAYSSRMQFFYPQVVINDYGYVIVGQMWDGSANEGARIIHLDSSGNKLLDTSFPSDSYIYDMRPISATNWNELVLTYSGAGMHRFRVYDSETRTVSVVKETTGPANAGRWFRITRDTSVLVNNPYLGDLYAFEGDILNGGELLTYYIPGATPVTDGYNLSGSGAIPTPIRGSVASPGGFYFAIDTDNPESVWGDFGPGSYLVYRMESNTIDQDLDRLPDNWEVDFSLDPFDDTGDDGACGDPDNDTYTNYSEFYAGTNPRDSLDHPAGPGEPCEEGSEGEGEGEGESSAFHSSDSDRDWRISLSELLRVIQFYNGEAYHCALGTEDGYALDPGDSQCAPHDSDYDPQDWVIGLPELLRLIQYFNSAGYMFCAEGEDGFCPL